MNETLLIELLSKIKPEFEETITRDTHLEEIELSSLDKMILICEIERHLGTQIQLSKVQKLTTVEDIISLLNSGEACKKDDEH